MSSPFTRPSTKAHREIWMSLDGDRRAKVRELAIAILEKAPDRDVAEVWTQAFDAEANPVPQITTTVPDVDPATPKASPRTQARLDRLALAEAEAVAVKRWTEGGEVGDRPETPNLDAIKAKRPLPSTRRREESQPAEVPAVPDGLLSITLRGKRSPGLVREVLGGSVDEHDRLVFGADPAHAQDMVDRLRAKSRGASQYVGRCLNDTIIRIRHLVPSVVDPDGGAIAKGVDALKAAGVKWEPVTRSDASTVFEVEGYSDPLTARQVIGSLGAAVG